MPELPGSLVALVEVGLALVRRTASGRVMLAQAAGLVDDAAVPAAIRTEVRAELDAAWAAVVEPFGKEMKPIAVTPTAQVHTDKVDGQAVAVKVARPGVAATIRSELVVLDSLALPLRAAFGSLDVRGVLAEVREAVMDELDLEHEAETQQRVRRALRSLDGVTVPEVFIDECSPTKMVSELIDGKTLADGATAKDPARVAELLVAAHLVTWRDAGLVCTDARPSHVMPLPDGDVALLGLGVARPMNRDRMEPFIAALAAVGADDAGAFASAVESLEILDADTAAEALPLLREILGDLADGEATLDAAALLGVTERAYRRAGDLLALGARATPAPADIAAGRMLGQLTATLARLGVTADWPALVQRAAKAA